MPLIQGHDVLPLFLIVGVEHKRAPRLLAERLQGDAADCLRLLRACRKAGLDQALALATCDRCEIWTIAEDDGRAAMILTAILAEAADLEPEAIAPHLSFRRGAEALRYAFAVAASLESRIVGEPQVLGQVKDAHRLAARSGALGPDLDCIARAAIAAGKRVRRETDIAAQSLSMAAAIIALARQVHGPLGDLSGLLIGDGDLGDLVVDALSEAGLKRWSILHPDPGRAESWARARAAHGDALAKLGAYLPKADIVIAALDAPAAILAAGDVAPALKARRRRPMLFVDLAIPGDIAPAIADLDDAYLYGFDDLERLALRGRLARDQAVAAAEALIAADIAAFSQDRDRRLQAPLLAALQESFAAERRAILAEDPALDAAEATRRLLNRLLHRPLAALGAAPADADLAAAARRLFALPAPGDRKDEGGR